MCGIVVTAVILLQAVTRRNEASADDDNTEPEVLTGILVVEPTQLTTREQASVPTVDV